MPFRSPKQIAYLKHNEPDVYERWKKKYGLAIVKSVAHKRKKK